jgi:hypothetical protein
MHLPRFGGIIRERKVIMLVKDALQYADYGVVGNSAVNWVDPLGLWSFSIGGYIGYGGTLTVGRDSGKTFVMVEGGVGIGGKLKYKPFGKFPNVPNKESCDAGGFLGFGGSVGGYLGPLSLAWEGKEGLGVSSR